MMLAMMRSRGTCKTAILAYLVSWMVSGVPVALAAEAVVTDVRVGPQARTTRVVFELNNPVAYQVFSLSDPYRVVIDMPEVGWRLPPRPLPSRSGVFETLRYGLYKPGNSRVVIDLNRPAIVKRTFMLAPGETRTYRLVVDLEGTSKDVFTRHRKGGPIKIAGLGVPGAVAQSPSPVPTPPVAKSTQSAVFRLAPRKPAFRPQREVRTVMIDPGHGGPDPGAIGISGVYEKHVTLAMARELKKQLEASGRYRVVLTRTRDIFIRLRDRVNRGREAGADLFISLHADSIKNRKISGPSVYTLSETASDKEAAALARKENKSDLIAGIDLTHENHDVTNILIDLAQRESMNQSAIFAGYLIKSLKRQVRVLRNTHRFAGFAVLKAPDVPSVLVEMGFLSSPKDERNLRSKKWRRRFAGAMKKGIDAYFARVEEARSR